MAVSGRRSFNLHSDQADVAAGSLDMTAFTNSTDFNTRKKVVCVSNQYIHEIILRPTQNCSATQICIVARRLSKTNKRTKFRDSVFRVKGESFYIILCITHLRCFAPGH